VAPILLGMTWFYALDGKAEPQPPDALDEPLLLPKIVNGARAGLISVLSRFIPKQIAQHSDPPTPSIAPTCENLRHLLNTPRKTLTAHSRRSPKRDKNQLAVRRTEIMAEATKVGAVQNSRLFITIAGAADKIHAQCIEHAISTLRDFALGMDILGQRSRSGLGLILKSSLPPFLHSFRQVTFRYRKSASGVLHPALNPAA
jgi:hypothetical protein